MQDIAAIVSFLVQSVLITIPGLVTPGPVMAVTFERGAMSPHAGAFVTLGHGFVELPLVAVIFIGLGRVADVPWVRFLLAFTGGLFLFYMSWRSIRSRNITSEKRSTVSSSSFVAGSVMTIANPFFLVWWATIGSALVVRSLELGFMVSILFYLLHITVNFFWLYFISYMSYTGHAFFGKNYRLAVSIISGALMFLFGGHFIITSFKILKNI